MILFHVVPCRVYVWDVWCIEIHCLENGNTPQVSLRSRPWRGLSKVRCFMSGWGFVSGLRVPNVRFKTGRSGTFVCMGLFFFCSRSCSAKSAQFSDNVLVLSVSLNTAVVSELGFDPKHAEQAPSIG